MTRDPELQHLITELLEEKEKTKSAMAKVVSSMEDHIMGVTGKCLTAPTLFKIHEMMVDDLMNQDEGMPK